MPSIRRLTMLAGAAEAARRYVRKNPDKVTKLAENAGRFVDKQTKGKYHERIDGAVRKVRSATATATGPAAEPTRYPATRPDTTGH
jgi:hypothetical protein